MPNDQNVLSWISFLFIEVSSKNVNKTFLNKEKANMDFVRIYDLLCEVVAKGRCSLVPISSVVLLTYS
jgi:hypothetical protein